MEEDEMQRLKRPAAMVEDRWRVTLREVQQLKQSAQIELCKAKAELGTLEEHHLVAVVKLQEEHCDSLRVLGIMAGELEKEKASLVDEVRRVKAHNLALEEQEIHRQSAPTSDPLFWLCLLHSLCAQGTVVQTDAGTSTMVTGDSIVRDVTFPDGLRGSLGSTVVHCFPGARLLDINKQVPSSLANDGNLCGAGTAKLNAREIHRQSAPTSDPLFWLCLLHSLCAQGTVDQDAGTSTMVTGDSIVRDVAFPDGLGGSLGSTVVHCFPGARVLDINKQVPSSLANDGNEALPAPLPVCPRHSGPRSGPDADPGARLSDSSFPTDRAHHCFPGAFPDGLSAFLETLTSKCLLRWQTTET
ncbi:hypothetical protein AAFF_G00420400 [Aldrovandia affinis]|uniref:Uncharacterized protein n=1 Tax=Aldrovandia affinis TaxID=143900 RepID=A0AAD7R3T7_9TELE|nr:hypothetical protein AAFF_G00420400 [Aldrovandia affinis]